MLRLMMKNVHSERAADCAEKYGGGKKRFFGYTAEMPLCLMLVYAHERKGNDVHRNENIQGRIAHFFFFPFG